MHLPAFECTLCASAELAEVRVLGTSLTAAVNRMYR